MMIRKLNSFLLFVVAIFIFSACNTNRLSEQTNTNLDINRIHDIWALKTIKGKDFTKMNKHPVLEIFVAEMKVLGNDGCNNISGKLQELTAFDIQFGPMMGTKMACPNMEVSDEFNQNLQATKHYKIENLELIFYDLHNLELLRFKKVD